MKFKSLILAAGQGSRLGNYTKDLPKCLVKIAGVPLLERQIEVLRYCSVNNISLVGGFCAENLRKYRLPIFLNKDFSSTNMVHSLFCARELFRGDHELIISYGDIVYSPKTLEKLLHSKCAVSVIVDLQWREYWESRFQNPLLDAETLKLSSKGEILEVGGKANSFNEIEGQYIGLIKLNPEGKRKFLEEYENLSSKQLINGREKQRSYLTDFLQHLINKGQSVQAIESEEPWVEIDNPEDVTSKINYSRLISIEKHLRSNLPSANPNI